MKDYLIGVLVVAILFLGSLVYKEQNTMVYQHFPVPEELKRKSTGDTPLYLFLFFSKNNCTQCLNEIVGVLNILPSQFCTAGVVPGEELKDEKELREVTKFTFPLYSFQKYKRYLPMHTPTLFGISPTGKIIFVFPGILGQGDYLDLEKSLVSIYGKLHSSFSDRHIP